MAKKSTLNVKDLGTLMPIQVDDGLSNFKIFIKCKNKKQKDFLNLLKNNNKKICFGMGSAGSGKSFISLSYALLSLKNEEYDQVVIIIPTCQAGSKEINLGFLPGEVQSKVDPYIQCSKNILENILKVNENLNCKRLVNDLIKQEKINYEFIQFMRGKTYSRTLLIAEESENISEEEMLLILTRIGEGSKIIIIGDELQRDRKDMKYKSGMLSACEKLKDLNEVGEITFDNDDVVRSELVSKILNAW